VRIGTEKRPRSQREERGAIQASRESGRCATAEKIELEPIGVIHTPFKSREDVPIQSTGGQDVEGVVEVYPEFAAGLADLDGFSHILLIFHFHLSQGYKLKVVPFMDTVERGVFSTRAPRRPNPLGVSVVKLERIEGNKLHIKGIDMVDGTPLVDIKPCVPHLYPSPDEVRVGWLEGKTDRMRRHRADKRFSEHPDEM
jgi:tRNA-Thr(GGU) m(6)t(6)A37 methyltransferase TsaA